MITDRSTKTSNNEKDGKGKPTYVLRLTFNDSPPVPTRQVDRVEQTSGYRARMAVLMPTLFLLLLVSLPVRLCQRLVFL